METLVTLEEKAFTKNWLLFYTDGANGDCFLESKKELILLLRAYRIFLNS